MLHVVLMMLLTLSSSDLLRYDGGSLGLTKYKDESTGESIQFFGLDDPALQVGKQAGVFAFVMGLIFLCLLAVNNFVVQIPFSEVIVTVLGAVIQLCLLAVYVSKDNGICEVEGCSWGNGATWLLMSQIMMLSASIGSLYTSRISFSDTVEKVRTSKETKIGVL